MKDGVEHKITKKYTYDDFGDEEVEIIDEYID